MTGDGGLVQVLETMLLTLPDDFDLVAVLDELCVTTCDLLAVDGAAIHLLDEEERRDPAQVTTSDGFRHRAVGRAGIGGMIPVSVAICDGDLVMIQGQCDGASGAGAPSATVLASMNAVAGLPVRTLGEVVGSLDLYSHRPSPFSQHELAGAEVLATAAGTYIGLARRRERTDERLQQLRHALSSRIRIEQAKGVLAERLRIPVDDAFELLRTHARNHNHRLLDVADAIVAGDGSIPRKRAHGSPEG